MSGAPSGAIGGRALLLGLALRLVLGPGLLSAAEVVWRPRAQGSAALGAARSPAFTGDPALWSELALTPRLGVDVGAHLWVDLAATAALTLGTDPLGVPTRLTLRPSRASVAAERLASGHLDLVLGRQALVFGRGLLVGDGVSDRGLAVAGAGAGALGPGAAQYLAPFDYWDALKGVARFEPLVAQVFVARYDPSWRWAHGDSGAGWIDGGVAGGDVELSAGARSLGLSAVAAAQREGSTGARRAARALALRGGVGGPWGWSAQGEVARQGGAVEAAGVRTPVHGWAAWALLRRGWATRPGLPSAEAGLYFFTGDDPDTPAEDEAWHPLFQPSADPSAFTLGELAGRYVLPATDLAALTAGGEIQPRPGVDLSGRALLLLTHRGTALCQAAVGDGRCVDPGDGFAYTAGQLMPASVEADLSARWTPRLADGLTRLGLTAAVAQPLTATRRPQREGGPPVAGDETALALTAWASIPLR